jgi:hypothetical protein
MGEAVWCDFPWYRYPIRFPLISFLPALILHGQRWSRSSRGLSRAYSSYR